MPSAAVGMLATGVTAVETAALLAAVGGTATMAQGTGTALVEASVSDMLLQSAVLAIRVTAGGDAVEAADSSTSHEPFYHVAATGVTTAGNGT